MTACGPHAKEENDCMQKQRLLADRTLARGPHACTQKLPDCPRTARLHADRTPACRSCPTARGLPADRTLARGPHAECTRHAETSMKYRKYEVPESLSVTTVCPQLLFAVCPQLLFALSYCLPSTTVCPQLLFALNHCPPSTAVCPRLLYDYDYDYDYEYDCDCDYGAAIKIDGWRRTS